MKVEIAYMVRKWLEYSDTSVHTINIACKTCGMEPFKSPISMENSLKPFLVVYMHSQSKNPHRPREKRQVNCEAGINECCKESLYISFAEIGWDDWIVQPTGYHAYFCKGSCDTAASLTVSGSQHNSIIQVNYLSTCNGN